MNRTASNWNIESPLARSKLLTNWSNNDQNNTIQFRNFLENQVTREHRITLAQAKAFFDQNTMFDQMFWWFHFGTTNPNIFTYSLIDDWTHPHTTFPFVTGHAQSRWDSVNLQEDQWQRFMSCLRWLEAIPWALRKVALFNGLSIAVLSAYLDVFS